MAKKYNLKFLDNGRKTSVAFSPDPFCCYVTEDQLQEILCPNFIQVPAGTTSYEVFPSDWGESCFPNVDVFMDIGDGQVRLVAVEVILNGISVPGAGDPTSATINFTGPTPTDNTYIVFK